MARKLRNGKTTEQKIEDINVEINKTEQTLFDLKQEKKELEKILEQEKIDALITSVKAKGFSLDKAKEIIDNMWGNIIFHKNIHFSKEELPVIDGLFFVQKN